MVFQRDLVCLIYDIIMFRVFEEPAVLATPPCAPCGAPPSVPGLEPTLPPRSPLCQHPLVPLVLCQPPLLTLSTHLLTSLCSHLPLVILGDVLPHVSGGP